MTLGEAASAFGDWLGISSHDTYRLPTQTRYDCLNWVMRDYSTLFDAKYNETSTTLTFSSGQTTCSIPSDFGRVYQMHYTSSDGTIVYLKWYATLEEFNNNDEGYDYSSTAGAPAIVALWGETFRFLPMADANYSVTMDYYQITPAITDSTSTNLWLTNVPNLIIMRALSEYGPMYAMESDINRTMQFKAKADELEGKYLIQATREKSSGRRPVSREPA